MVNACLLIEIFLNEGENLWKKKSINIELFLMKFLKNILLLKSSSQIVSCFYEIKIIEDIII